MKSPLPFFLKKNEYIIRQRTISGESLVLYIFPTLSLISQLIVVTAVIYVHKALTAEMRILAAYSILYLVVGFSQLILALKSINNLWTGEVFSPIQFAMLMYVFYVWNRDSKSGRVILYSIPTFVLAWGLGLAWLGNAENTFNYMDPISAVLFVVVSSYTLLTIERVEGSSVLDMPSFWISSATVIYFGSTIVLSSLSASLLRASIPTMQLAWSVQAVVNILANLMYAGGFLCLRRKT